MPYLAIILVIFCFFKTLYYSIYELKINNNKPGGIEGIIISILRTYISYNNYYYLLHLINYSPLPSGNAG